MRASARLIGLSALLLTACTVEPHSYFNGRAELAKLKGPAADSGSVEVALRKQAEDAQATGNYNQAAALYKKLLDKTPGNPLYMLGLAENLRRSGSFDSSLQMSDTLLKKDPENAGALENKSLCLISTGEFAEAGTAFGHVMKIDPKRWRTLNGIGILFAMKGKYDAAIQYYQAALDISTDNANVLNNAALTYAIDRQFPRAYEMFDRARRHVTPGSAEAKHIDLNLALVYAVDGRLDDAEQIAAPHLSKAGLYNNMGFYSYLAKNNDLAKGYLNMALTQSPTYYERAWKNLGALTGDTSSGSGEAQAMPAGGGGFGDSSNRLPRIDSETTPADLSASVSSAPLASIPASPAPAGIALDDIPSSKPTRFMPDAAIGEQGSGSRNAPDISFGSTYVGKKSEAKPKDQPLNATGGAEAIKASHKPAEAFSPDISLPAAENGARPPLLSGGIPAAGSGN